MLNISELLLLVSQFAVMLVCALAAGALFRRFHQPAVVGEMLGGVLLGPTVFGAMAPEAYATLFLTPDVAVVRGAVVKVGMLYFLFLAGLEMDLHELRERGRATLFISLAATLFPIVAGVGLVYAVPPGFWGTSAQEHFILFAVFIGLNFANSAIPVLARILFDLKLLDRPFGRIIMGSAVVDDLVTWAILALVLGGSAGVLNIGLLLAALFVIGRWLKATNFWMRAILVAAIASLAEALGIHAFVGTFLLGVALSGGEKKSGPADVLVQKFLAPIYFVSIGLLHNFVQNFDLGMVAVIFAGACVSKLTAVLAGARMAGVLPGREAWAAAFALNARGAVGIVLAGIGLSNGLIDERMFIALAVTALATSLLSGPAVRAFLGSPKN